MAAVPHCGACDATVYVNGDGFMYATEQAAADAERRLDYLILTMPEREIVSVSLREGIDLLDDLTADFGDFYILETR